MKEAFYYERINNKIRCNLCPKGCLIKDEATGFCRGRINISGKLYLKIYEECSSIAVDPIEKKPLYHFYPGSLILSLGTTGCSFHCPFCQNWHISQQTPETEKVSSEQAVKYAKKSRSIGIAYTYSEPLIWYEYVYLTAKLAKENNLKNVLVTNGYINEKPLLELLPFIDAINLDIKFFKDSSYREYCGGSLKPVLRTAELAKKYTFLEVTNLIIPTINDSEKEISKLVDWIKENLGKDTPVHFSRYFPHYKMHIEPTPISTLQKARSIASEKLEYVYLGNVMDKDSNTTYCPSCNKQLIVREGYNIYSYDVIDTKCKYCNSEVNIVV